MNGAGNTRTVTETRQGRKYPSDSTNSSLLYPVRIHEDVFRDMQTALDIAEEIDIYYNFTLFGSHGDWYALNFPQEWIYNTEYQDQLTAVISTLYERFKNHPRILAREIWNKPDQGLDIYVESPVGSGKYIIDPRHATRRQSLLQLTGKLVDV